MPRMRWVGGRPGVDPVAETQRPKCRNECEPLCRGGPSERAERPSSRREYPISCGVAASTGAVRTIPGSGGRNLQAVRVAGLTLGRFDLSFREFVKKIGSERPLT